MAVYKRIIGKDEKGNLVRSDKYSIDYYYKGRKVVETVGSSKREAENLLAARKTDIQRGKFRLHPEIKDCKFKDYSAQYYNAYSQNKRCVERERVIIDHLKDFMKDRLLSSITGTTIEEYKAVRAKEVSLSTVNREFGVLSHLFNMAIKDGKLESNPAEKIKFKGADNKIEKILTVDEMKRLIDASSPHLKPILITALNTGMRKQEILTLKWDCVDFEKNTITISAANSKSKKSRAIPISNMLQTTLSEIASGTQSVYVFSDPSTNKPYKGVKTSFTTARKNANISCRFHDLRHNFATHAIENGVDIKTISEILGHSDIKMTMRYLSPTNETKTRAVNIIGNILEKNRTYTETLAKTGRQGNDVSHYDKTSPWRESNPQPRHYECRALPLSHTGEAIVIR